jgi:hypothetical protein
MDQGLRVMFQRSIALLVLVLAPALAFADDVFLKGGGRITGRIVARSARTLDIDIGAGRVTLSMNSVERIEEGRSPLEQYDDRAAAMAPDDRDGWLRLARWASGEALGTQARRAYERVLEIDPANPEANQAFGRVELDGRWVTEEERYRARGYVQFEGEWLTPAERETILQHRAAALEAERARLEAELRTREAEARALEAEARAREVYPVLVAPTVGWWGGSGTRAHVRRFDSFWGPPRDTWTPLVSWSAPSWSALPSWSPLPSWSMPSVAPARAGKSGPPPHRGRGTGAQTKGRR